MSRAFDALRGRVRLLDPRRPAGPDHLVPEHGGDEAPRIVRFLADDGTPHLGMVLESEHGAPRSLLDLTARHRLPAGFLEAAAAGAFDVAEGEQHRGPPEPDDPHVVQLADAELPDRLLSPVDIPAEALAHGHRLVIGFGLTFRDHREETGGGRPFVFPKPTVPRGAYRAVPAGPSVGGTEPERLLDYELELGCVALRDIDLGQLDRVDPAGDFAYLVVNDLSARGPIVRDRRRGYVLGKGRPGYLPAGPWVMAGSHFLGDEAGVRKMVLTVEEPAEDGDGPDGPGGSEEREMETVRTVRQEASLDDLSLGVRELLELVARRRNLTMRDAAGRAWPISVERDRRRWIPAGSLLLTGTPGGTAIRSPDAMDRLALVMRSLARGRSPTECYRRHLEENRQAFGFLAPGDRVSAWITGLGRQEWEVV